MYLFYVSISSDRRCYQLSSKKVDSETPQHQYSTEQNGPILWTKLRIMLIRRTFIAEIGDPLSHLPRTASCSSSAPCGLRELWFFVRIGPIRFLAGCRKRRLNQG